MLTPAQLFRFVAIGFILMFGTRISKAELRQVYVRGILESEVRNNQDIGLPSPETSLLNQTGESRHIAPVVAQSPTAAFADFISILPLQNVSVSPAPAGVPAYISPWQFHFLCVTAALAP